MRPVLTESHGRELQDSRVGLGGEVRKHVSGWVERVCLFTFLDSGKAAQRGEGSDPNNHEKARDAWLQSVDFSGQGKSGWR